MDKDKKTKIVQKRYDRFSYFYDFLENILEKNKFSNWRKDLFKNLRDVIV